MTARLLCERLRSDSQRPRRMLVSPRASCGMTAPPASSRPDGDEGLVHAGRLRRLHGHAVEPQRRHRPGQRAGPRRSSLDLCDRIYRTDLLANRYAIGARFRAAHKVTIRPALPGRAQGVQCLPAAAPLDGRPARHDHRRHSRLRRRRAGGFSRGRSGSFACPPEPLFVLYGESRMKYTAGARMTLTSGANGAGVRDVDDVLRHLG
jgi:hypothetical protein